MNDDETTEEDNRDTCGCCNGTGEVAHNVDDDEDSTYIAECDGCGGEGKV